jgi:CBS domain-containing protein
VHAEEIMKIRDIMTRTPACCAPDTPLDAVSKLMLEHDCGEIPVCDDGEPVGVITDRDIAVRAFTKGRNPLDTPAYAIMTKRPVAIAENEDLDTARELMEQHQVRRLLVTRDGKIVGIVSQADLVPALPERKAVELLKAVSRRPIVTVTS